MTLEDETSRSVDVQYATWEEKRNSYRENEQAGSKQKWCSIVDVSGGKQRRQWQPTPVRLPGKSPGLRSLVGCSPWGREQSDTTARLHLHFSLSYIGEGNSNPLQCSCLEDPRTGEPGGLPSLGSHSQTWLKRLSSSSSSWWWKSDAVKNNIA